VTIPPGARSSRITLDRLLGADSAEAHGALSLLPDGDSYTLAAPHDAAF
jgi:hypothetical protein